MRKLSIKSSFFREIRDFDLSTVTIQKLATMAKGQMLKIRRAVCNIAVNVRYLL